MTSTLKGKTALVTGSSRGIGRAIASGLAREGALVAVHYGRDKQSAQETVGLIEKDGGGPLPSARNWARPAPSSSCLTRWRPACASTPARPSWTSW